MLQPYLSKLGEPLLVSYVLIEVERTPLPCTFAYLVLKEREITKHWVSKERVHTQPAKPEWQLVVILSSPAGRLPQECAN
eukprot:2513434-Amphidinium_carterae.1